MDYGGAASSSGGGGLYARGGYKSISPIAQFLYYLFLILLIIFFVQVFTSRG